MAAEQRAERTELEPTQVQLAPLVEVRRGRRLARIAILQREPADVVRPVGDARHRNVDARRDLRAQVIPAARHVARPHSGTLALQPAKPRPRQDERTNIRLILPPAVIDRADMDQRIAVEILRRRSRGGRAHRRDPLGDRQVRMNVGLARIEPPCVGADLREAVLDLPPVDRPRLGRIGIVIGIQIARPDPVLVRVIEIAAIGVALRRQLLVVLGRRIEFRPDRDHEARVHVVDLVDHLLRLGEARLVELVAAPSILGPVEPVLDDVIERDLQIAVFLDDVDDLVLRIVALARLPEAVRPFRHHHGLAG